MSVQFGIAAMTFGGVTIGYLQGVTVDFNYDVAQLYSGGAIFPVDVRVHTGVISGSAEFANITAAAIEKLLGGTRTGDTIDLDNTDYPETFSLVTHVTTDSIQFKITFNKCRATSTSFPFSRDSHVIPNFEFNIEADANGNVATIDVGDIS